MSAGLDTGSRFENVPPRENGGPAFPVPAFTEPCGDFNWGADGMTLRDYFAAKVMQGMMVTAVGLGDLSAEELEALLAKVAAMTYEIADAMLKARSA